MQERISVKGSKDKIPHFTPLRMAIIKKQTNKQKPQKITSVAEDVENRNPCTLLAGM